MYYDIDEFKMRLERFAHSLKIITEHNLTKSNYKLGLNQLSTFTAKEYFAIQGYNGRRTGGYVKSQV